MRPPDAAQPKAPSNGVLFSACDQKFTDENASKLALDAADTLAHMMTSAYDLRLTAERHPLVHFHPLREHAGLSLSSQ